MEIVHKFIDLA